MHFFCSYFLSRILKFRKVKLPFPKLALSKILVSYIVAWGVFIKFLNILFAILSLAEYIPIFTDMQYHLLLISNFFFLFHCNIFPAALSFKTLPDKKYNFLSIQRFVFSPDTSSNDSWWVPSNIQDIRNIQNMKNINYWSTATSEIGDDFWFSFWEVKSNFTSSLEIEKSLGIEMVIIAPLLSAINVGTFF